MAMAEMAADVSVVEKSTDATTISNGGGVCGAGSSGAGASGSMLMVYGWQTASVVGVG